MRAGHAAMMGPWLIVAVHVFGASGHVTALDSFRTEAQCLMQVARVSRGGRDFPPAPPGYYQCWTKERYDEWAKSVRYAPQWKP